MLSRRRMQRRSTLLPRGLFCLPVLRVSCGVCPSPPFLTSCELPRKEELTPPEDRPWDGISVVVIVIAQADTEPLGARQPRCSIIRLCCHRLGTSSDIILVWRGDIHRASRRQYLACSLILISTIFFFSSSCSSNAIRVFPHCERARRPARLDAQPRDPPEPGRALQEGRGARARPQGRRCRRALQAVLGSVFWYRHRLWLCRTGARRRARRRQSDWQRARQEQGQGHG